MKNEIVVLSGRKKQILFGAIDNYIKQASPITSLFVQNTEMHDISTATIRNELSALEAMGYLKQLHTSGGRVPTTKGYRFFVNEIINNITCTREDLRSIKDELFLKTGSISEIVKSIADAITKSTNYPAVVILDGFENLIVQSIGVMYLLDGSMLILIQTNAGVITNTLTASEKINKSGCDNASKIFTDIFGGKTIGFLMHNMSEFNEKIQSAMKNYEEIFKMVLIVLEKYAADSKTNITSDGIVKLLNSPEYSDIEKAKDILNILDDKQQLKNIFDASAQEGLSIKIGEENENKVLSGCAVIKTPIVLDGNKIASIGIIGPERIDYANIASALKFIADEILIRQNKNGGKNGKGTR